MTQSIEEIILSDPHMIEIVPGEEWDFPEIDYSKLKPQSVENAKRIVETIIKTSISFPTSPKPLSTTIIVPSSKYPTPCVDSLPL